MDCNDVHYQIARSQQVLFLTFRRLFAKVILLFSGLQRRQLLRPARVHPAAPSPALLYEAFDPLRVRAFCAHAKITSGDPLNVQHSSSINAAAPRQPAEKNQKRTRGLWRWASDEYLRDRWDTHGIPGYKDGNR